MKSTASPTRYVAILTFFAGMLVAGVLVPLATRDSDDHVDSVAATPSANATTLTTGAGAEATTDATVSDASGSNATGAIKGSSSSSGAGTGTKAAATTARTATDVGVSADEIKVGFILLDLAGVTNLVGGLAGASADDQKAALQAFIDEANTTGGINGRKIVPIWTTYDPVSGDANTNCNQLTEDDKVFAIVSEGIFGSPVLCVTQQHGTPLVNSGGYIDEYYARSRGLLFTFEPTKPRSSRSGVFALERDGVMKGKTVGVFTSRAGDDDVAVDTGTVPALNQLGYKVAHISRLSADNTNSSQIPVEVNAMRSAGVNLVFLQTNVVYDTQFVQQADSQGFRPLYSLSDSESNMSDFFLSNMPSSFQAVGYTVSRTGEQRVGAPESPIDADCRKVVEKSAHKTLERGSAGYGTAMNACNQIRTFVRATRAAGVTLTRGSFSAAMQAIGSFPQAYTAAGSFRVGKFDAADSTRRMNADMGCKCWKPAGDFQPMHN